MVISWSDPRTGVSKHALPKSRIKDVKVVVGGDQYLEYVRY